MPLGLGWLGTVVPGRGPARRLSAAREEAIVSATLSVELSFPLLDSAYCQTREAAVPLRPKACPL